MYTDFRERAYTMMNYEKVLIRRRGRCTFFTFNLLLNCIREVFTDWELYWPRGNRVATIIEGGEIAGINGFMFLIDNVLIYEPDLYAGGVSACPSAPTILLAFVASILVSRLLPRPQRVSSTVAYVAFLTSILLDIATSNYAEFE